MSLLFNLPTHLLSYIYSFDNTYRELMKNLRFRFEILLRSGAAHKLIEQYIQEMFHDNMVWHNNYGTFGLANRERSKSLSFYSQYKLFILHETTINYIYYYDTNLFCNFGGRNFMRFVEFVIVRKTLKDSGLSK